MVLLGRPSFEAGPGPPYLSHEIHPGVFSARQCGRIAALAERFGSSGADLEGDEGQAVSDASIRRSATAWIPPEDDTWWIYDKLAKVAERANRRYGFELTGFGEDLQLTTYAERGDFYTWHQDGLDGALSGRKLSLVVQLSDPAGYAGGELQFFDMLDLLDDVELAEHQVALAQQGTVVAFPSFEYHRVLPLRSGLRRSLVAWVSGPPFR